MESTAILYPGIAMFSLTFGVVTYMGVSRFRAVRRREVSVKYYRLYNEGEQPPRLQLLTRHAQNHFEVPPLFYIVLLFIYVTDHVSPLIVRRQMISDTWVVFLREGSASRLRLGRVV